MDANQERIAALDDVLAYMESHERTTHDKGDMWERVCAWYLRNDPEIQQVVGRVWRWDDAENPLRTGHDAGIDIVAERADAPDTYWAVQCKNFDAGHKVSYGDLSTFFAAAEADDRYTGMIVATASEDISSQVESHLLTLRANRGVESLIITPTGMAQANVDWTLLMRRHEETPEERWARTYSSRPHQQEAIEQIQACFERYDRAKAIMACGTGKTLTALRLAEKRREGAGVRDVLFCAPSIALVSQAMREWTNQARVPLRSLVVCSDAKASKVGEDDLLDSVIDVGFPATTSAQALADNYRWTREHYPDDLIVVFSTYQSMQVVQDAQVAGMPRFGLCICDEAHRTAGTKFAEDEDVACYQIVVDGERVRADKRLFMTATPKVYGENVKTKAGETAAELYSMDDEEKYGPVAYEITFADAVEKGLLCDYRVVVLAINQDAVPGTRIVVTHGADEAELDIGDEAKIIGCWRGLATHGEDANRRLAALEGDEAEDTHDFLLVDDFDSWDEDGLADILNDPDRKVEPLRRAVGFCSTIQSSKDIDEAFTKVVDAYVQSTGDAGGPACRLDHVDGSMDSKVRAKKLGWLAADGEPGECRILTNARCLAEGVDVPSLDAVIFFSPKRSKVDVVQAVGRVMRTFHKGQPDEKKLGYIILPVAIPSEMTPEEALNQSDSFDVVWGVLQALRSHDQRIDAYINSLPMRKARKKGKGLSIGGKSGQRDGDEEGGSASNDTKTQLTLDFGVTDLERAVYAKAVEKCGSKVYWSSWAEDVGRIAQKHIEQIHGAVAEDPVAREAMDGFLKSLRDSLNPGVSEQAAIEMVSQHMVTLPVFDALFGDYAFAKTNPVSVAITEFLEALEGHGIGDLSADDQRSLDELYRSVRRRASFCRTDANRQSLIKDLYNDFFSKAFTRTKDKLGIVYTPIQIVDYMLHATNRALEREFGRHLCDNGVHILDPFSGTGTYMAQLVSDPELLPVDALPGKYANELHSNELLLLAYYIMVVNVEYAYHSRVGGDYVPFEGAVLTDTFQMDEGDDELDLGMFVENSERVVRQQETPITVIVGNPPYSAGQKNANDDNRNEHYPTLERRIQETYSAHTDATNKNSLMDSYIEAFRWASDRIGDEGIVSFVSNGGWLRSDAGAGVRRCFTEEFNSIYVFDLLGNQRTQGEESRRQGGKVFGSGCRAPITITTLVKNPGSEEHGAIHYFCVGEYKTQEEKLTTVASYRDREPEWEILEQDRHGDWLDQRDEGWYEMAPTGVTKGSKKTALGMWNIWSNGLKTNQDAWVWNYSHERLERNTSSLANNTNHQVAAAHGDISSVNYDPKLYSWTGFMLDHVRRNEPIDHSSNNIIDGIYRPYCKQKLYNSRDMNQRFGQPAKLFPLIKPNESASNVVIALTNGNNYSCLVSNVLPDLHFVGDSQCFPLYWYEKDDGSTLSLMPADGEKVVRDAWGARYVRHDAITDEALKVFRDAYPLAFATRPKTKGGAGLTKEDVFWYVYSMLHSPEYRGRFSANLQKELPRIPLADDFEAFCEAGRALGELHLGYESVEPWPNLEISGVLPGMDPGRVEKLKWGKRRNLETGKLEADKTVLVYNKRVSVKNIPEGANDYAVNGRSPLEWMIDRYQVKTDKATGIVNDPNEYSDDPRYILNLICRLVTVSVKTSEIVAGLPRIREIEKPVSWPVAWKAGV